MNTDKDINNMKMWVFRLAQTRWKKTSEQCARIFKDNGLYKVISDGYDYLHLMGYNSVVTELEEILAGRGVKIQEHNDKLREYGAVTLMQRMLEKYAEKYNVSIDEALSRFAASKAYDALFDYDGTELWKEGPDYMLNFFEQVESAEQKS